MNPPITTVYNIPVNGGGKKLFFLDEKHAKTKPQNRNRKGIFASVSRKYGYIIFSVETVEVLGMDNSFLKFYFDKLHRTIGFRVKKELAYGEKVGHGDWRFIQKDSYSKNIKTSIVPLLNEIQSLDGEEFYHKLEIKKYKDYIEKQEFEYYYITLNPV